LGKINFGEKIIMALLTTEAVLTVLKTVQDPDLNKDIVSLDFVREVKVEGASVSLKLIIPNPSPIAKANLEKAVKDALSSLPSPGDVQVAIELQIPNGRGASGKQSIAGVKNIIAVSSGKGGVGKSSVAVNLAVTLAQWGAKVGLVDTDVYGPNVPIMMGIDQDPLVQGQKLLPLESYGVKVMSIGFLNRGDRPVIWRGPMLGTAVRQFLYDVLWGELDYLIVDMPPGTGDVQLSLAQLVPVQGAVLVTTPQEVAMADVRKALNMFEQVHIPVFGIVENMSYFVCSNCSEKHHIFGSGGGAELASRFKTKLLGQIPLSTGMRESGDAGLPIVIGAPGSLQAEAFREIAANVAAQVNKAAFVEAGLPIINMGDGRGDSFTV
jgi:ATP-binding protein involved in chromosome partitioning